MVVGMVDFVRADPPAKSAGGANEKNGSGIEENSLNGSSGFEVAAGNRWLI